MQKQVELNKVQVQIMRNLFASDGLRFAQLNTGDLPNDHFSYHIRKLLKDDYIIKKDDGHYYLTTKGKTSAILLDTKHEQYINQGFIACRVVLTRQYEGQTQYLLQRRTRVPFRGYLAEPGGKILWGETVLEGARRNMLLQTGLDCELRVRGQVHIHDQYNGEIVQDKYFYVISVESANGELLDAGPTGKNIWLTMDEIKNDPKTHKGVVEICGIAESDQYQFLERLHHTDEY